MSFRKIFFATFLAIIAGATLVGLAVSAYINYQRSVRLNAEVRETLFDGARREEARKYVDANGAGEPGTIHLKRINEIDQARERGDPDPPKFSSPVAAAVSAAPIEGPRQITYATFKLTKPFQVKDRVGNVIVTLQPGQSLPYTYRDNYVVWVNLSGSTFEIPISCTDLK